MINKIQYLRTFPSIGMSADTQPVANDWASALDLNTALWSAPTDFTSTRILPDGRYVDPDTGLPIGDVTTNTSITGTTTTGTTGTTTTGTTGTTTTGTTTTGTTTISTTTTTTTTTGTSGTSTTSTTSSYDPNNNSINTTTNSTRTLIRGFNPFINILNSQAIISRQQQYVQEANIDRESELLIVGETISKLESQNPLTYGRKLVNGLEYVSNKKDVHTRDDAGNIILIKQ